MLFALSREIPCGCFFFSFLFLFLPFSSIFPGLSTSLFFCVCPVYASSSSSSFVSIEAAVRSPCSSRVTIALSLPLRHCPRRHSVYIEPRTSVHTDKGRFCSRGGGGGKTMTEDGSEGESGRGGGVVVASIWVGLF